MINKFLRNYDYGKVAYVTTVNRAFNGDYLVWLTNSGYIIFEMFRSG